MPNRYYGLLMIRFNCLLGIVFTQNRLGDTYRLWCRLDSAFFAKSKLRFSFFPHFTCSRDNVPGTISTVADCSSTVAALFITVHALKNIKNGSHDTIYTFKNYFATVLSVFSFQFLVSVTISSIQTDPITHVWLPSGLLQISRKNKIFFFFIAW